LPAAEFASGVAEALKHAVLEGGRHFALFDALAARGRSGADRPGAETLEDLVGRSIRLKAAVVARDERESGERRLLNLGHTIGHAVESATGIRHGHAVAAGLASICRFSVARGAMLRDDAVRVAELLLAWGLPASLGAAAALAGVPDGPAFRDRVAAALPADKKRVGSDILVALPRAIGKVGVEPVPLAELEKFVREAP
jgi:3-dehydroquinate synthase